MENDKNLNINKIININGSFESEENISEFNSIEEERDHYKIEYLNYKSKYKFLIQENNNLIKERNRLLFQIGKLKNKIKEGINSNINNNNILKNNKVIINKKNNINNEDENFDIEKEIEKLNKNIYHKNDDLNESIFNTLKEETKEQNKILDELNDENKKKELEEKELLSLESMDLEGDDEDIEDEDEIINNKIKMHSEKNLIEKTSFVKNSQHKIIKTKKTFNKNSDTRQILAQKNIIINSILNYNNNISNDFNRTISVIPSNNNHSIKFDQEIIEKSLINEFILYKKDSINFRKLIISVEKKINNVNILIKRWSHYSKILKKGIETFYKAIELFNKNLLNTDNDNFIESPDLLGLIYLLQKNFRDIIEHCKSFINTIDSLFILQIENIKKKYFQTIKIQRYNLSVKISELINLQNKFLSTKKNSYINSNSFKSAKDNYYLKYKTIEVYKYDYLCSLNKILMMKQIELPQVISLLSFSIMVFFRQVHDVLKEIDGPVKDNLEKINARVSIKNNIIENMKKQKSELETKIFDKINIDKNLIIKEGFLNVKEMDNNSNFKRRYVKIFNGNLIYFNTKKANLNEKNDLESNSYLNMIEKININEYFNLCNLLLSNVKKNEKKYEYPFCFEIVDASSKKSFILQADTEYETNEWISTIQNAISERISNFDNNQNLNDTQNRNNLNIALKEEKNEQNNNVIINNIIKDNICADCGAKKPTWLCINWLTIICIDCSAIHRSLGVNISKVKGFRLDNINSDLLELLNIIKQNEINSFLEKDLMEGAKPNPQSKNIIKEEFIIDKYKNRKYLEKTEIDNIDYIIDNIIKAIDENNLLNVYKYIKQSIEDINDAFNINGEEYGLMHYCAGKGKIEMVKLLCILGADINKEDKKGLKPIIYAKLNKNTDVIEYLNRKEKI